MKYTAVFAISVFICICLVFCFFFSRSTIDNKTVIKFSSWGSQSEIAVIKTIIKNFEKQNPDIKVDFIHIPQNYFQKLQLLFASGLEPDVIFINNQNIPMYINASLLENLSGYFNNIDNDFNSQAVNCFKKNGNLYAIPRDISNLVIYYNKDIFKKQNIKVPEKIKDIYELRTIAKKVTTEENFGINFEENILYLLYYLSSNGGGILSDDGKKIIINDLKSIEALNLYSDMINKDFSIPSKSKMGSMTSAQMFINGKLAMYLSGRWMTPKFKETIHFDWDVMEFPSPNKVYIDASGWAVAKNSKHKKEAIELIKILSSSTASEMFAKSGLIVPANKNVDFSEINKNEKPYNAQIFISMIKNAKPTPVNENYATINDIITEKLENVLNGSINAKNVFDDKTIRQLNDLL